MDGIIVALIVLGWIGKSIYQFIKWAGQQAQGQSQRIIEQPLPPTPMPAREPLRTISRPTGDDLTPVPDEATRASFVRRERALARQQDAPSAAVRDVIVTVNTPAPSLDALFSQKDDLLRAFVMREALGPPRRMIGRLPQPPPDEAAAISPSGT